jgi:hypothetical protein
MYTVCGLIALTCQRFRLDGGRERGGKGAWAKLTLDCCQTPPSLGCVRVRTQLVAMDISANAIGDGGITAMARSLSSPTCKVGPSTAATVAVVLCRYAHTCV